MTPWSIISGCTLPIRHECPLDLSGSRTDSSRIEPGEGSASRGTDLTVRHTGYVDKALAARKLDARSPNPRGRTGGPAERSLCAVQPGGDRRSSVDVGRALDSSSAAWPARHRPIPIVRKLFALIARDTPDDGRFARGPAHVRRGFRSLIPENAELWFRKAVVAPPPGLVIRGRALLAADPAPERPDQFCSAGPGEFTATPLPAATWRPWPPNAAIMPERGDCGKKCWPNARATRGLAKLGRGATTEPVRLKAADEREGGDGWRASGALR